MRILTFILLISLCSIGCAQKKIFVRVYNATGEKMSKGNVSEVTDTSLQLTLKKAIINIPVSKIGLIKTERSAGNDVFNGSVIGTSIFAILFASVSTNPDQYVSSTAGEAAAGGALIGLPLGAAVGGLAILFKNSNTYLIKGDFVRWKEFQASMTEKSKIK